MNNYTTKNPSPAGREYMVTKFNQAFNMSIKYKFFKNKMDEFKKDYKRWKFLMNSTGISVDPDTLEIHASSAWWKERETDCQRTSSFKRKPPELWDVMQRCFALHDVQSQSQHYARQRIEELNNEGTFDDEDEDDSDTDNVDMFETQIPKTQEDVEVYRVNVDDDSQRTSGLPFRRGQQRGR